MPHLLGDENVIFCGLDYSNEIYNPCDFHLSHADVCADCLAKENCKVVIFKYVFCWLLFRAKFDCNFIQSYVPCICCGNLL